MYKNLLNILLLFIAWLPSYSQGEFDSLVVRLEKEMAKREIYDQVKESRIANLKALLNDDKITLESHYFIKNKLITEYEYYSFDSTLYYIEENLSLAKELANDHFIKESTLRLAKLLATSGRYDESIDLLIQIAPLNLSQHLIREYYTIYKRCYSELRTISRVKSISIVVMNKTDDNVIYNFMVNDSKVSVEILPHAMQNSVY